MATKKELQGQLDAMGVEYGSKDTVAELEEKLAAATAKAEPEADAADGADAEPGATADGEEAEPGAAAETSEWRVLSGFNDRHTGEYHEPGSVIEVTAERAAEILGVAKLIERA